MSLFKNRTNKVIRLDSRTYIAPNETKDLDEKNRNVQMYVAIRYLERVYEKTAAPAPEPAPEPVVAPEPAPEPVVESDPAPESVAESVAESVVEAEPVVEVVAEPVAEEMPQTLDDVLAEDKPRRSRKKKSDE